MVVMNRFQVVSHGFCRFYFGFDLVRKHYPIDLVNARKNPLKCRDFGDFLTTIGYRLFDFVLYAVRF